jgi:SAM-dependent methyltransferase
MQTDVLSQQRNLYQGTFYRRHRWRWMFRDDCRYRWHRLREVLFTLGISSLRKVVYEIGFGSGDLLFQFPSSCTLMGAELSADAVTAIQSDPRLALYRDHWFRALDSDGRIPIPEIKADIVLTSHVLEHVPDDRVFLEQALPALAPDGIVIIFVPLESPGFDPKHVRTYSVRSLCQLVRGLGLEVLHVETNYHICAGPFRWMDHPARHDWPCLQSLEGIRNVMMTVVPYRAARGLEEVLALVGVLPTQIMLVAGR